MKKNVYSNALNTRAKAAAPTLVAKAIPGREREMAANHGGGVSFITDMFTTLDRFLILGSETPTYAVSATKLTKDNAQNVIACVKSDGVRVVNRIVEISVAGRAPKNDPALLALAVAFTYGDAETKRAASEALPKVARIGTHLFHFAEYLHGMRSWGRPVRRAMDAWYNGRKPLQLAQQITKYASRDGWSHADIIKLAHVKPSTPDHHALFDYAQGHAKQLEISSDVANYMAAVEELKTLNKSNVKRAVALITDFNLPREVVPTELLNEKAIWEALVPHMGLEALVRNLATMTRVGIIAPFSDGTKALIAKMQDAEQITKSKLHPIKVLGGLLTYKQGHGFRGTNTWTPDSKINAALDDLFYATFQNIIPTGKNTVLGLDISGSMGWGDIAGMPGLNPRVASAAMAMVTMRSEENYEVLGFSDRLIRLDINAKMTLEQVVKKIDNLPFGSTNLALPFEWAKKNKIPAEAFAVYTDNDVNTGYHPAQRLVEYRKAMGIDAKLAVVGMTATRFTIADPKDKGMLDVVGFDTATPTIMADFFRGEF